MGKIMEPEVRSYIMSQIKSKDTKPEMKVRKFLHAKGLRYRLHYNKLPGKPDLVFPKYNAVVFVNGCFWHMHGCKYASIPKTNAEWWRNKLEHNVQRDKQKQSELEELGWNVIVIWECELKGYDREKYLRKLYNNIAHYSG